MVQFEEGGTFRGAVTSHRQSLQRVKRPLAPALALAIQRMHLQRLRDDGLSACLIDEIRRQKVVLCQTK